MHLAASCVLGESGSNATARTVTEKKGQVTVPHLLEKTSAGDEIQFETPIRAVGRHEGWAPLMVAFMLSTSGGMARAPVTRRDRVHTETLGRSSPAIVLAKAGPPPRLQVASVRRPDSNHLWTLISGVMPVTRLRCAASPWFISDCTGRITRTRQRGKGFKPCHLID